MVMRTVHAESFVTLCVVVLMATSCGGAEIPLDQAVRILTQSSQNEVDQPIKQQVLDKARSDPVYRQSLVKSLADRLVEYKEDYKGGGEVRALAELDAKETLPQLRQRWQHLPKRTYYTERIDPRLQLLLAITKFLPESESLRFLMDTERDANEASTVRFRAMVSLCASGKGEGIQRVLSVCEQAKKQYGRTTRMSVENQNRNPVRKEDWDRDADMMTDSMEAGLLLDPNNKDTDGDGLLDGNDRNPLCAGTDKPSEDQQIAQTLLLLYMLYSPEGDPPRTSNPSQPNVLIANLVVDRGETSPNPLAGMELLGVDAIVLHLDREGMARYRDLHGYGTPTFSIHQMAGSSASERRFRFSRYMGPTGASMYEVTLKRFNGVWLPVVWELRGMA
jgi:hypothetical protein